MLFLRGRPWKRTKRTLFTISNTTSRRTMKFFAVTLAAAASLAAGASAAQDLEAAAPEGCTAKNVCNYVKDLQKTVNGIYDELDEAFTLIKELQDGQKGSKSSCAAKCHKDSVDCKRRCQYNANGRKVLRLTTVRNAHVETLTGCRLTLDRLAMTSVTTPARVALQAARDSWYEQQSRIK